MLKKWIFAVLAALFLSVAYADDKEDAAYSMAVSFCRNKSDTHAVSVSGIQYLCSALKDKTMVDKYGGEYEYLRRGFRCYGGIVCSLDSPESSNVGNVGVWKKRFCIGNWCVYSPTNLTRKSSELQFVGFNEAVAKYENQNGGGNPSSPSNGGGNPSSPPNGNPSSPPSGNPSSPPSGNPSSPPSGNPSSPPSGNPSSPPSGNPSSPPSGNPSSPPSGDPSSPPSGNPSSPSNGGGNLGGGGSGVFVADDSYGDSESSACLAALSVRNSRGSDFYFKGVVPYGLSNRACSFGSRSMRSDWSTSSVVSELPISSLNDLRKKNCDSTSFNKFDTGSGTFSVICTAKADKTSDSKPSVDSTESVDNPADSGGKDKTGKDKGSDSSGGDTVNGTPRDKGKLGGDGSGDSDKTDKTDKDKDDDGKDDKTLLDGILDGIKKLGDKVSDGLDTLGGKHDDTNKKLDDNGKKQDETNAKISESNTLLDKVVNGLNALTDAVKSGFEKLTGKKDGTAAGDNEPANGGGGSTVNVPGQNGNGQNGGGKDGGGESGNGSGELQGIGEGFFDGVTIPERQAGQGQGGWQPESLGGGGAGSCPAPKVFHIATYSVELSYEPLCRFLEMVRWAVLLGFTLVSAFIVFGSLRD